MKRGLIASYLHGISDTAGERYSAIMRYFIPEVITAFFLYSLLAMFDSKMIAGLRSTSTFATLGASNTLLHFIIKVAEGVSIGATVLCGHYNGSKNYEKVGRALIESLWVTVIVGATIASILFFGAHEIYRALGVPEKMIFLGVPFLRTRAIGVFFTFVYFACVAFLRGIKDTKTPMMIFILGGIMFMGADYALVHGHWGMPALGLRGSALAGVLQYAVMTIAVIAIIIARRDLRATYNIQFFRPLQEPAMLQRLFHLSWPAVLDKATMAVAYIWLGKMIAPLGTHALASFYAIKELERFAFLPANAFSQVITFLVSNNFGSGDVEAVKSNIKKVLLLACAIVMAIIAGIAIWPAPFVHFFDEKGAFTNFAASAFPFIAVFLIFDVIQIVLAGALRGAADAHAVMWVRLLVCGGFFFPLSYAINYYGVDLAPLTRFILVFSSFYIGPMLMTAAYVYRFRRDLWRKNKV